ncbi:NAD(P)/FAD-dependent oxidoreductase [Amycolatopsis jiangsuensis]|uniref:Sarcosine oxidase subunit beta n=1 Tax=Amycolatopsis jiangsuensis TaxID=1181879 RepID=A0A840J4S1_9PSEU|nr:FAD-binding oxidoreductase [Amycolatopsis jiangsuensis]MBB4688344.1 sarcosine oxidase subunit beta [Amycolatopsis jiangsuensis]
MQSVEYIVVGGGVVGTATAWHLASRGAEVTLLEARELASGASGGPGRRGVRAGGRDLRELPLARRALELWPELDTLLGAPTGYHRNGLLSLYDVEIAGVSGWQSLPARQQAQRAAGIPCEIVDRGRLEAMQPGIAEGVRHALHTPDDGTADHPATTRAFGAAARKLGAAVHEHTGVAGLVPGEDGSVTLELTTGERMRATRGVVLAANRSTPRLLRESIGVSLPLWEKATQVTFVRPPSGFGLNHQIGHTRRSLSVKMTDEGSVMLSGGRPGSWDPVTGVGTVDPDVLRTTLADLAATLPELDGAEVLAVDNNRADTSTIDLIPVIDKAPGLDSVFVGTGWSGHGFALAPAVAEAFASWALDGKRPETLRPFTFDRLGAVVPS